VLLNVGFLLLNIGNPSWNLYLQRLYKEQIWSRHIWSILLQCYHLCWDLDVECHFQKYVSYSMAVNSLGWGNQQRIEKSLTNFAGFKVVTCTLLHGRKSDGSGNRHCNSMDQICLVDLLPYLWIPIKSY
jgi:hypothetical protein